MHPLGSKQIRTTAYHPIANGIIERFHHQPKAALKSHPNPTRWFDYLPLVLLGIRTAVKDDLHCSAAKLVYGTTLHLPGKFFDHAKSDATADPANYVIRLRSALYKIVATFKLCMYIQLSCLTQLWAHLLCYCSEGAGTQADLQKATPTVCGKCTAD